MEEIGMEITANNFSTIMSILVEARFQEENTPKDILFIFAERLVNKLKTTGDYSGYVHIIMDYLQRNEILIASLNSDVQNIFNDTQFFDAWQHDS